MVKEEGGQWRETICSADECMLMMMKKMKFDVFGRLQRDVVREKDQSDEGVDKHDCTV